MPKVETAAVTEVGNRIATIQRRKAAINTEVSTLRTRLAKLEEESRELATEHHLLLRRFDSVAALP